MFRSFYTYENELGVGFLNETYTNIREQHILENDFCEQPALVHFLYEDITACVCVALAFPLFLIQIAFATVFSSSS